MGIVSFVRESAAEMRHVSWPTRRQVVAYTVLVIVVSALIASYLGALDAAFTWALEKALFGGSA
ncbi:MAG TPA: preprotein translocase subunit SecE [Candidatus Paceibacterota bacterium]